MSCQSSLHLDNCDGISLAAYSAEPASSLADNLALLASWAATNVAPTQFDAPSEWQRPHGSIGLSVYGVEPEPLQRKAFLVGLLGHETHRVDIGGDLDASGGR